MADVLIPMGEWNFNTATSLPVGNGQIRANGPQNSATRLWINKTTEGGADATTSLQKFKAGQEIDLHFKTDAAKWQVYTITAAPTDAGNYFEFPVAWARGGSDLVFGLTTLSQVSKSIVVNVQSPPLQPQIGTVTPLANQQAIVEVTGALMRTTAGNPFIVGHVLLPDMAYPSDTPAGYSHGMTLRQWYAGQALTGFISNSVAANLIGALAPYCFKVADSMIAYEVKQLGPPATTLPPVPIDRVPQAPPPQVAPPTVPIEEALDIQKQEAAE